MSVSPSCPQIGLPCFVGTLFLDHVAMCTAEYSTSLSFASSSCTDVLLDGSILALGTEKDSHCSVLLKPLIQNVIEVCGSVTLTTIYDSGELAGYFLVNVQTSLKHLCGCYCSQNGLSLVPTSSFLPVSRMCFQATNSGQRE